MDKTKTNSREKFKTLLTLFIKSESVDTWDSKRWSAEAKASSNLLKKYPDFDFFETLKDLHGKFNSLMGLISKKYVNLEDRYYSYLVDKKDKKRYNLDEDCSSIVDLNYQKTSKTFTDYLS